MTDPSQDQGGGSDAANEPDPDFEERKTSPLVDGSSASEEDNASGDASEAPSEDAVDAVEAAPAPSAAPAAASASASASAEPRGPITMTCIGRTDVGLVRDHNEDNFLVADLTSGSRDETTFGDVGASGMVFAVCDGMGGAAAGEVASQMAVDTILEQMSDGEPTADRDKFAHRMVRAVEVAGARIFESANEDRTRRGMGTTSTVTVLMDQMLFVGQVGDSRAYVLRNGKLGLLTKDQSLVNQLIEAGQLTEDEAEAFEHSNIILQALGTTDTVTVDLTFLELRRGDRLMVCSDGLCGLVHNDVIRDVMSEYTNPEDCNDRLIELAKAGGGHDNITVVVVDFEGEGLAEASETDIASYQQYPLPIAPGSSPTMGAGGELPAVGDPSEYGYGTGQYDNEGGGSARYVAMVLVLVALGFAVYYWTSGGVPEAGSSAAAESSAAQEAQAPAEPEPVEVVVRTDVLDGELRVDGESYGAPDGDRWMVDLPPGPHRLEARKGGDVVASSLVTLREGIPATVFLSMPEVIDEPAEDEEPVDPAAAAAAEAKAKRDAAREERHRKRREAAEAAKSAKPAAPAPAPAAAPAPAPAPEAPPAP